MSETDLYNPIKKALERCGHVVTRVHSGKVKVRGGWMQLAEEGTPDHVVSSPNGLTTWLETKTPIGKLNDAQKTWHERAKRNGHRVAVVRTPAEALAAVMAADGVCGCCFRKAHLPNGFACKVCLADKSHPDPEATFHGYDPKWDEP